MGIKFQIAFSRFVDYALLYLLGVLFSFISPVYVDPLFYLVLALLLPLLWAPLEVFAIHKLGTTPGSWLFGIHYEEKIHHYHRLKQALWREKKEEIIDIRGGASRFTIAFIISIAIILLGIFAPFIYQIVTEGTIKPTIKGWLHYREPQGAFNVDFPTEPYHSIKELSIPITRDPISFNEYRSFSAKESAITYAVSFIHLPLKVRFYGDTPILKACFGFIPENGPTTKVISHELAPYRKHSALNFSLRNGDEHTQGRLIITNGILYKLTVTYPQDLSEEELDILGFLDSFRMRLRFKD